MKDGEKLIAAVLALVVFVAVVAGLIAFTTDTALVDGSRAATPPVQSGVPASPEARRLYVETFARGLRDRSPGASATLSGEKSDVLAISDPAMDEAAATKWREDYALHGDLRRMGFLRVTLAGANGQSWTIDLL